MLSRFITRFIDIIQRSGGVTQHSETRKSTYMKHAGNREAVACQKSTRLIHVPAQKFKMPTYKLTYFNITGLAEPIRYILHQSKIKFEDKRLTFEEWPQYKNEMPLGQVPILEIDGKPLPQSKAVCRLLARQNNLAGSSDEESYRIDAVVDTIDDLRQAISQYHWEKEPAAKEKLKANVDTKLPFTLQKLNDRVKKEGGHFVNGKLSWADLYYAATSEMFSGLLETDVNKDYPELKKLVEKVRSLPNIKAYLETRPKTMF